MLEKRSAKKRDANPESKIWFTAPAIRAAALQGLPSGRQLKSAETTFVPAAAARNSRNAMVHNNVSGFAFPVSG
jgi:hypothetical protein